jgi:hypothetical protein
MKLNYNILWIDDNHDYLAGYKEDISDFLEKAGLNMEVTPLPNGDMLEKLIESDSINDFDMVLMDWNLGEEKARGDDLAQRIRSKFYVEIVFYSAVETEELRVAIANKRVDGVYCASRTNDFLEVIKEVIKVGIKKLQHPNAIRGLFMAETAEFDWAMSRCIERIYQAEIYQSKNQVLEKITNRIKKAHDNQLEKIRIMEEGQVDKFFYDPALTAVNRLEVLRSIFKEMQKEYPQISEIMSPFNDYKTEIIEWRNKLAHVRGGTNEKGKPILILGTGKDDIILDDGVTKTLRHYLRKHQVGLDALQEFLGLQPEDESVPQQASAEDAAA